MYARIRTIISHIASLIRSDILLDSRYMYYDQDDDELVDDRVSVALRWVPLPVFSGHLLIPAIKLMAVS